MDYTTEANPNGKRVKVTTQNQSLSKQPTAVDMAKLAASVLLPSPIKALAIQYHSTFLQLRIDLHNLESTHSRLANKEEFLIPHLACFKLNLNASKRVKELASKQYEALVKQADIVMLFLSVSLNWRF
jgi:hypothetical protein